MPTLVENFTTNNISNTRKLIADFCAQSPMFNVVATKVNKRHIELADGYWLGDFGTQDYLSLDFEPDVINSVIDATQKYGTVVAWCRLVATVNLFTQAEKEVAELVGAEAANIFASTTLLNHGVIPALLGKDGVMFLDKAGHATLYEGAKIARDSGATLVSFPQDDFTALEKLLIEHQDNPKKLIVTDGVYSMTGEYANLPVLDALAKKYNALLYVDDAHGFGVVGEDPSSEFPYGHKGNGLVKYYGLNYDNIVYVGCFSKAYGSYGAFIASSKPI
ncbi:aminotransferase class I/II-fold pyridoxal phosphate-dependent enzyme, partial [Candidatus Woesebacteria bacterium]|nr:aminotransferase class I/II-fold pyridoxal phosphate-dependent enzyme [Candidatus Woesebacteria bacterium]